MYAVVDLEMVGVQGDEFTTKLELRLDMARKKLEKKGENDVRLESLYRDYATIFGVFEVTKRPFIYPP